MKIYIIKRVLLTIPMLFAISFIAFILTTFIPSDPAEVALRVNDIVPTQEVLEEMRIELGLDKPFFIRYFHWLYDVLHLDFGTSYINKEKVLDEILRSLPSTLTLAFFSFVIVVFVSIPLGILSAILKDTFFDKFTRLFVFIGTAMPNYWVGLLLIWLFAIELRLLPTSGASTLTHYILPAVTLSLTYISTYVRLVRNSMLDNMKEDYIFYAKVRGISEKLLVLKHLLKNSLHSSINALGMSIVMLIAGTFVIESVFSIPGIGRLCISAIFNRDYPVIQAYILIMGVLFVFFNLFVDILQAYLDPRLKKSMQR